MRGMTLDKIAKACEGELFLSKACDQEKILETEAVSIVIDSRIAEKGGIFVATKGERVNGHSFIKDVLEIGALGVICEQKPELSDGNYIVVKDSFEAIRKLAKYYRSLFQIPFIGITGSMGKTSTKEMIAAVLSERFNTLKTEGNYNNQVGVPLTIFGLREEHEMAVIEMGISEFNEMSLLSDIVRPDSMVITNIGPCHLEYLNDLDGVFRAKTEVFPYMSGKGVVCLNGDDARLIRVKEVKGNKPVFYGRNTLNDIYAYNIETGGLQGTDVSIHTKEGRFKVHIPLPGKHMVDNALAATAIGMFYGLTLSEIREGIETVKGVSGRLNPIRTENYLLVDDCYNANPKSMEAGLTLLEENGQRGHLRTVAILGDMLELGEDSERMHARVGAYAARLEIDMLLIVGEISYNMYDEVKRLGDPGKPELYYYKTTDELIEALRSEELIKKGDVILVKASHAMQFERVVKELTK